MLDGVTPAQFRKQVLDVLLKMLNIPHTRKTMVGSGCFDNVEGCSR